MYVKIFSQIYDSSIAEDYLVRLVFEDLLILADRDGHVDMTVAAIARRTNVPLRVVNRAIEKLSSPDPDSRTPDEEGRRIVLLDPHRSWGWRIVNYANYRNIRNDEDRREYNREKQREFRSRRARSDASLTVKRCQQCQPRQKQKQKQRQRRKTSQRLRLRLLSFPIGFLSMFGTTTRKCARKSALR